MRSRLLIGAAVAVLALGACGGDDDDAASENTGTTPADGEASAGGEIPARIVSLSPTATENLFAIGAGDLVVAADDQSDYPDDAPTTELSGYEPNVEAIAGYEPDLVVMQSDVIADELERLDIDLLVQPAPATLEAAYAQIVELGEVTGHADDAQAVVDEIRTQVEEIVAEVPDGAEPLTYYYELDSTFFSATSATFIGDVLTQVGLTSIADAADDGTGYPQLSAEYIIDADPDLVLLADTECCGESADTVRARAGWDQMTAVRDGRIVELDDDIASRWGPRVVELLADVVDVAYAAA